MQFSSAKSGAARKKVEIIRGQKLKEEIEAKRSLAVDMAIVLGSYLLMNESSNTKLIGD